MNVQLNGVELDFGDGASVADLLAQTGRPFQGVAVAVDGVVVPRSEWEDTVVPDGATVEIVTAVQGG